MYMESWYNVVILPSVFIVDEFEVLTDVSSEIEEIGYLLDDEEYNTLLIGEFGEFDLSNLYFNFGVITVTVKMSDGTVLIYTFSTEIQIITPR